MIAPPEIKTPEQYFASLDEPRRSDMRADLDLKVAVELVKHAAKRHQKSGE